MKKTCALMLLALFFFVFALAARPEEEEAPTTVNDIYGKPLTNGAQYYTLPGLTIYEDVKDPKKCILEVGPADDSTKRHRLLLEIEFPSGTPRNPSIKTNQPLNITMSRIPEDHCAYKSSHQLMVVKSLDTFPGWPVKIGNPEGIVEGKFSIQPHDLHGYKLVFCEDATKRCGNVGIHTNSLKEKSLTVTAGTPLSFQFQKDTNGICTTHSDKDQNK